METEGGLVVNAPADPNLARELWERALAEAPRAKA